MPNKLTWDSSLVQKFWDYHSLTPENYFTSQFGSEIIESFDSVLRKSKKIVDYGAGLGFLTVKVLAKYQHAKVSAKEFSQDSKEILIKKTNGFSNFEDVIDSKESLDQYANYFDSVLFIETIEHLDDYWLDKSFDEISIMLKNDGYLLITTPNDENLKHEEVYCPNCNAVFHRWQDVRSWNEQSIKKLLDDKGFDVLSTSTTNFALERGVLRRNRLLIKKMLGHHQPHLVVIAVKR